jgi:hypothetical protein
LIGGVWNKGVGVEFRFFLLGGVDDIFSGSERVDDRLGKVWDGDFVKGDGSAPASFRGSLFNRRRWLFVFGLRWSWSRDWFWWSQPYTLLGDDAAVRFGV